MVNKLNQTNVIEAKGLSASYRDRVIWQDANFKIKKGEFVGILGPNGAGKSTLFKLLLGLIRPSAGSLTILGESPKRGNKRFGYVPQRRPIDQDMNIEALELVKLGAGGDRWGFSSSKKSEEQSQLAMKALKDVDATSLAHQPLGVLSGGELQRVFLAQALVGDIDILLLDEPLANLDIRRETSLVHTISDVVKRRQITALLIAHDLNPLLPVLDRVIYITNGRVATGTPDEVVNSKSLSELYGAPIEVLRGSNGKVAVLGAEEVAHHE